MNIAPRRNEAYKIISSARAFAAHNVVFVVAAALAVFTSFIITPDEKYFSYFDFKTLTCLFCTLAVVCALKNIRFFTVIAQAIIRKTGNTRSAITTLVFITFFGSMLIANDMALLTFLPLGYLVLTESGKERFMAFTFIMQNIAANLGGMLTPFGNPQNLYLYTRFGIPNAEFMSIMLFPFAVSTALILVCCLFVKKKSLSISASSLYKLNRERTALYLVLFAYAILLVFRTVPFWTGLVIIPLVIFIADKNALKQVDYPLLLTFACFFVFAGNMSRIPFINSLFSQMLQKNTLVVSALSCQVISNVPSAILLSQFTDNYGQLLMGVNIGGTGTLIASLASLITFREYVKHNPGCAKKYIIKFSAFNFAFLAVLLLVCSL